MSFQVGIGSLGGTVFSGGTLYPSVNYASDSLKTDIVKKLISQELKYILDNNQKVCLLLFILVNAQLKEQIYRTT